MVFALQALESFVSRSPNDARPFLDQLLSEGLTFLKHDPNYAVEDMDEDEEGAGVSRLLFICPGNQSTDIEYPVMILQLLPEMLLLLLLHVIISPHTC